MLYSTDNEIIGGIESKRLIFEPLNFIFALQKFPPDMPSLFLVYYKLCCYDSSSSLKAIHAIILEACEF